MKRIYVAGASAEFDLVRGYMQQLVAKGWTITLDWTQVVEKTGSAALGLHPLERCDQARQALQGVWSADVFWLVMPQALTIGAWVELGAAVTHRDRVDPDYHEHKPFIVVSGSNDTIFALLAEQRFATHEEALAWLLAGMPTEQWSFAGTL